MWKSVGLMGEIKEQMDRIEGKFDELLNRIGESCLEKKHEAEL